MPLPTPGPGRPPGTKNKRTIALEEKLEAMGCDPITFIATVMMDDTNPIDLRMKAATELAPYLWPKRRAMEHTGDVPTHQFVILGAQPDATAEQWERRNNPDPKDKLQ